MKHLIILLALFAITATAAPPATLSCGEAITVTAQCNAPTPTPTPTPIPTPTPTPTPTPQPPVGWGGSCPGYANTIVIDFNWAAPVRAYTGHFGALDIVVARFKTGNFDSASNNLPRLAGAEWQSPPSARYATLSDKPCDLVPPDGWPLGSVSAGNSVQIPFAVGNGNNFGYYPRLQKNTVYYFNVKNLANQTCTASDTCDMFLELLRPQEGALMAARPAPKWQVGVSGPQPDSVIGSGR